jgi:hypothetical protein
MRSLSLTDFYEAEGSTLQPPDPEDEPISLQAFVDTHPEPSPQTDKDLMRKEALAIEEVSEYESDDESRLQTDDESTVLGGDDQSTFKDESNDDS